MINSDAAPVTVPVPSLPAVAFQPIFFKAVTKSSAVTNLPPSVLAVGTPSVSVVIVAVFGINVIVSPLAVTSNKVPSLDLTVNLIPSCLFRFCASVSVATSLPFLPANLIVLLASLWNWLPLIASLEFSLTSPSFTFVTFTGFAPSLSDTLMSPSEVLENFGPWSPPTCTVSNTTLSFVANVNLLPSCVILIFLSASKVTLSPAFTNWLVAALPNSPSVVAAAVAVHAALFIAFTTVSTVVNLFPSPVFATTLPLSPSVVAAFIDPFSTLGTVTSTVTVCFPFPSVVALTTALFFPINSTSFVFFTCAENGAVKFPVVLLLETTHPIFLKSPTVATFEFGVVVVLLKSTNPALFPES